MFGVAASLPLVLLAHTTGQAIAVSPFIPLFVAMTMANSIALLSSVADSRVQGEIMGVNSSFEALAQGIPAVISGYIASVAVTLPALVGSTIIAFGGFLFLYSFKAHMVRKQAPRDGLMQEEVAATV